MELERSGDRLTVRLSGEITSANTPKIIERLFIETDGITELTFDLKGLEYVSLSGLRMFIMYQKLMKDKMSIKNVPEEILELFRIVGFIKLLNII